MIYRGFNETELNRIREILERNSVHFTVSVPTTSIEYMNDTTKRVNHKFIDSLLQIEIAKEEFDRINSRDIQLLFDLRIYKEEDSPFTEEEMAMMVTDPDAPLPLKKNENMRINQIAAILAVLMMGFLFLRKKGLL